jgi:hypothetical protein
VETAALWKRWKNKLRFPTVPTALGKLAKSMRVSHSSHSPDYGINKKEENKTSEPFSSTVVALPN